MLDSDRRDEGWSSSPRHYSCTALLTKLQTDGCGSKAKLSFTHQGPSSQHLPHSWKGCGHTQHQKVHSDVQEAWVRRGEQYLL